MNSYLRRPILIVKTHIWVDPGQTNGGNLTEKKNSDYKPMLMRNKWHFLVSHPNQLFILIEWVR